MITSSCSWKMSLQWLLSYRQCLCLCSNVAYVCVALVPWSAMLYQFQRNAHSKMVFIFDVSSKSFIWLFVLFMNKVIHCMCLFTFKKKEQQEWMRLKKIVCLMEINGGMFFSLVSATLILFIYVLIYFP